LNRAFLSLVLVSLIILSSFIIRTPVSAIPVYEGFDCWPSKYDYEIGEVVVIFVKVPMVKLPMVSYLLVWKPDGSTVRVDLGTIQKEITYYGIGQAGPPPGQRKVELWGQYEGQWYMKAYCFFNVVSPFDFKMSVDPISQTIRQGESATFRVTVTLLTGSARTISLSLIGHHQTMTWEFNPSSGNPTFISILTIGASRFTPTGIYKLTITGRDGGKIQSTDVTLAVGRPAPMVTVRITNVVSGGFVQRILREGLLSPLLEFLGQEKFPLLVDDVYITVKDSARDIESVTLILRNDSPKEVILPTEIKASRIQEGVYQIRVTGSSPLSQKDRERAIILLVFNLVSFGVASKITDPKVRQTVQYILHCLEKKGSGTEALERMINPNVYLERIDVRYADGQVFHAPPSIVTPSLPQRLETFVDGLKKEFEGPLIDPLIDELIEKLRGQVKSVLGCSTVDLLVKTPSGKRIGTESGQEVNEVAGAYYDAKTSLVLVPVEQGTYTIRVYGRSSGSYDLFVWSMSSESAFQTTSQIEPGKTHEYRTSISEAGKVSISKGQDWGATIVLFMAIVGGTVTLLLMVIVLPNKGRRMWAARSAGRRRKLGKPKILGVTSGPRVIEVTSEPRILEIKETKERIPTDG